MSNIQILSFSTLSNNNSWRRAQTMIHSRIHIPLPIAASSYKNYFILRLMELDLKTNHAFLFATWKTQQIMKGSSNLLRA